MVVPGGAEEDLSAGTFLALRGEWRRSREVHPQDPLRAGYLRVEEIREGEPRGGLSEGVIRAQLLLDVLTDYRHSFPALRDIRPEFVRKDIDLWSSDEASVRALTTLEQVLPSRLR